MPIITLFPIKSNTTCNIDPARRGCQTHTLGYDAEGHLVSVSGPSLSASFVYDGDGKRVKSIINGEIILFVGAHFEFNDTTNEVTKYYFAGGARVAMRKYIVPETNTLTYLLSDHLGSTSIVTDDTGTLVTETRYKAWGEVRYATPDETLPTRYTYTGQYSYVADAATDLGSAGFGLMYYNARWYDPYLNRFAQADSIIPGAGNPQAWEGILMIQKPVFMPPLRPLFPDFAPGCDIGAARFQPAG